MKAKRLIVLLILTFAVIANDDLTGLNRLLSKLAGLCTNVFKRSNGRIIIVINKCKRTLPPTFKSRPRDHLFYQ